MNMITVGKDNCGLFPVIIEVNQGVCVSQSNITGNYILSGRAEASSEDSMMNNRTVMNNKQSVSADVASSIDAQEDQDKLSAQRKESLSAQNKQSLSAQKKAVPECPEKAVQYNILSWSN